MEGPVGFAQFPSLTAEENGTGTKTFLLTLPLRRWNIKIKEIWTFITRKISHNNKTQSDMQKKYKTAQHIQYKNPLQIHFSTARILWHLLPSWVLGEASVGLRYQLSLYVKLTDRLNTRKLKQTQAPCLMWNIIKQSWAHRPHARFPLRSSGSNPHWLKMNIYWQLNL